MSVSIQSRSSLRADCNQMSAACPQKFTPPHPNTSFYHPGILRCIVVAQGEVGRAFRTPIRVLLAPRQQIDPTFRLSATPQNCRCDTSRLTSPQLIGGNPNFSYNHLTSLLSSFSYNHGSQHTRSLFGSTTQAQPNTQAKMKAGKRGGTQCPRRA